MVTHLIIGMLVTVNGHSYSRQLKATCMQIHFLFGEYKQTLLIKVMQPLKFMNVSLSPTEISTAILLTYTFFIFPIFCFCKFESTVCRFLSWLSARVTELVSFTIAYIDRAEWFVVLKSH